MIKIKVKKQGIKVKKQGSVVFFLEPFISYSFISSTAFDANSVTDFCCSGVGLTAV